MVFGVEGVDAARTDDEVVDIAAAVTDRYRVEDSPPGVAIGQLGELGADLLLTASTLAPRPRLSVYPQQPGEECPHRRCSPQRVSLRPSLHAGSAVHKILEYDLSLGWVLVYRERRRRLGGFV